MESCIHSTIVIEKLRMWSYISFGFMIILCYIITTQFGDDDDVEELKQDLAKTFGSVNICYVWDTDPANAVALFLWPFTLVGFTTYSCVFTMRAYISLSEGKISHRLYNFIKWSGLYFVYTLFVFTYGIATQPSGDKVKLFFHTLPFTQAIISLLLVQWGFVMFGAKCAWKGVVSPFITKMSFIHVVLLTCFCILKITRQIYCLSMYQSESQIQPHVFWTIIDKGWFFLSIVVPFCQSYWLGRKGDATHTLELTIEDNRPSNHESNVFGV